MNIEIHQLSNQMKVYKVTIVEIQMVNFPSGAILQTQTQDGITVNQRRLIKIHLPKKEHVTHITVQLTV